MPSDTRQRRQPLQARGHRTVERILTAATELILEDGIDAAAMTAIAARAGVGPASLYRFFADRDEILLRLLKTELKKMESWAAQAEDTWEPSSLRDYVEQLLGMYVEYQERNPLKMRIWYAGRVSSAVTAAEQANNVLLARRTRDRLIGAGLVSPDAPAEGVLLGIEVADRIIDLAFRGQSHADPEIIAAGAEMLVRHAERYSSPALKSGTSR
ncbi:MAG: TetR/AcrR family transcriptional regulator [Solirubrobacteraceae bacterium]